MNPRCIIKKPQTMPLEYGTGRDEKQIDPNFSNSEIEWLIVPGSGQESVSRQELIVSGIMMRTQW